MKSWSLTLLILVVLALAAPTSASSLAQRPPVVGGPLAGSGLQISSTGWIIWETSSPIQRLALDGDSLWAGAYKGGLFEWDLERGPVASYDGRDGLPGRDVISIAVDGSGNKWIALLDGGVARSSGGGFADMTPSGIAGQDPWALAARGGEVWLATLGGGVSRRSGGSWTTYSFATAGLPSDEIHAIAVESDGTPWIGTIGYGVAVRQGGSWVTYDPPLTIADPRSPGQQIPNRAITDIAVDADDDKWFGSDGSGVAVLDGDWTVYNTANSGLSSNFVQSVFIDSAGNRWFGTLGGGVSRLSAGGSSWSRFDTSNSPMTEDDILDVVVDGNGGLWLASYDAGLTFYGALPVTPPVFDLDPRGEPTYLPGKAKGYYLWVDPATYVWSLAWSGDGRDHDFSGEVVADGPVTLGETEDFEAGDSATAVGNVLQLDASESDGQDLVKFTLDGVATQLTVRLQMDGAYYPFSLRVGGKAALPGTAPFTLTAPQPQAPVVSAGVDVTVNEGDLVLFHGSYSDPDSPTGHTIVWNLDAGVTEEDTLSPSYTYADDGIIPVTLIVTDVHGRVGSDALNVTVENVAPEVDFFAEPFQPSAGQDVTFEAFILDLGENDTHTYLWDFGDGSPEVPTSELLVTHNFPAAGGYEVTLTATDDDGGVGSVTQMILVLHNPPAVDLGEDAAINEGQPFARAGSFADPDSSAWSATVDYGDGGGPQALVLAADKTFQLGNLYKDDGDYPVEVCVADSDTAVGCDDIVVQVQNLPPVVDAGDDVSTQVGQVVPFSGFFSDPGVLDTHAVSWDFGDGTSSSDTLTPTHSYSQAGSFTVTLQVTDDDGGVGTDTLTVQVAGEAGVLVMQDPWNRNCLRLDLGSGAYTWRTPSGSRYSNFAVVRSLWGLLFFQSAQGDPNTLTGLVVVRARLGTARLFVPGFPWPRIYYIVDTNVAGGQCP